MIAGGAVDQYLSVAFLLAAWGLAVYLVADLLGLALSPTARRAVGAS